MSPANPERADFPVVLTPMRPHFRFLCLSIVLLQSPFIHGQSWSFSFESTPDPHSDHVHPGSAYRVEVGYGFEHLPTLPSHPVGNDAAAGSEGIRSTTPFVFSVQTGEGNFRVRMTFRGPSHAPGITLKAESRRLMIHQPELELSPRALHELTFVTNVRTPRLAQGGQVQLHEREQGVWHWDDRLQMEVHAGAALVSIEIERVQNLPVLYLMGDSTVTDQTAEPWIGWGQMLPVFFESSLAIANHAESGETLKQFRTQGRLEKVMDSLNPGDFVMLQFGHNDMKEKGEGIGAMSSYAHDLRSFLTHLHGRGAQPILVTPVKRRRFDAQGRQVASLGDYPLAVRRVAAECGVPLLDLNLMSGVLFAALGPDGSKQAFVHYPAGAFPGQTHALQDDSHFNAFGGHELANSIVEALRIACPSLAQHLRIDREAYDPASPRDPKSLRIPPSPRSSVQVPEGS